MFISGVLVGAFVISYLLTRYLRGYAIRNNVIDLPNQRSSHTMPTPRGGGVAIVISVLAFLLILCLSDILSLRQFIGFFVPGIIVAAIGFLDDHGHIAARWRLLTHFTAAALGLLTLGEFPLVHVVGMDISLHWIGIIFGLLYLVWMLNLYNFMDGINGLASAEAITFSLASILILYFNTPNLFVTSEFFIALLICGATFGFILWNFPKAKIFMGDAGSGFLGITIGLLTLHIAKLNTHFFLAEICILGIFIIDATITLIRRMLKGKKVYEAHASHCYQILSRKYGNHKPVTIAAILINLFWLLPIAMLIASAKIDGLIGIIIAWLPLGIVAIGSGGGVKDKVS